MKIRIQVNLWSNSGRRLVCADNIVDSTKEHVFAGQNVDAGQSSLSEVLLVVYFSHLRSCSRRESRSWLLWQHYSQGIFAGTSCISDRSAWPHHTDNSGLATADVERGRSLALIRRILHVWHPEVGEGMAFFPAWFQRDLLKMLMRSWLG
jgi:hypothetical protein